jgi:hypothetical protein
MAATLPGGELRLYKRLVYDMQIAQDVSPGVPGAVVAFQIVATPRPGHTVAELQKVIDEEIQKLQRSANQPRAERSVNQIEASFYRMSVIRRQGRPAECACDVHRRSRLVNEDPRHRAVAADFAPRRWSSAARQARRVDRRTRKGLGEP